MKVVLRSLLLFVSLLVASMASAMPTIPTTPVIDGVITDAEWHGAQIIDLQVNVPEGGTVPARLYLVNDEQFLYVGLRILRNKLDAGTGLSVTLDANGDRLLSPDDDIMAVSHDFYGGDRPGDAFYYTGGVCPQGAICSGNDADLGGSNDVVGAVSCDGTYVMYEMSKPLMTSDGMDATMIPGSTIGMTFDLRIIAFNANWPDGFADTYYPAPASAGRYVDYTIRDFGVVQ